MRYKFFVISFLLGLLLYLPVFATNYQQYVDTTYFYRVEIPVEFSYSKTKDNAALFSTNGAKIFVNAFDQYDKKITADEFNDNKEKFLQDIKKANRELGFTLIESGNIKIDGKKGVYGKGASVDQYLEVYAYAKKDKVYIVTLIADKSLRSTYDPIFKYVLSSFKVLR